MIDNLALVKARLSAVAKAGNNNSTFFKTGPGHYAEHDRFLGVKIPDLRAIAKDYVDLNRTSLEALLASVYNEERLLALIILVNQYNKTSPAGKEEIYQFYLSNLDQVNNWNLVDASAHLIIGAHLFQQKKQQLLSLASSEIMWHRRIAMVSTWHFIRQGSLEWTFKIAKLLLNDQHDLIHKATGWMLREAGKQDLPQLINFLDQHATNMPRTSLRYAIERFAKEERRKYLKRLV